MIRYLIAGYILLFGLAHESPAQFLTADSIPVSALSLPEGYRIEVYASGLPDAREMDLGDDGTLFAGSTDAGKIYAITADRKVTILDEGLDKPAGLDYYGGDLYVAEVSRILKYENILAEIHTNPEPIVINGNFPREEQEAWKFIRIGPDQKLYITVGAPCNACVPDSLWHARILRMTLDGAMLEIFASGIRNCQGLDWDPLFGALFFTDMSRDGPGDALSPDELNKVLIDSQHYGFPYVTGSKPDPEFWPVKPKNILFTQPAKELPAHAGAQGMRFYSGKMFEKKYQGGIFVAEHGYPDRLSGAGFRISFIPVKEGRATGYEVFCEGWLRDNSAWGAPADVQVGPDGSLFVSDDLAGCIYRIYRQDKPGY